MYPQRAVEPIGAVGDGQHDDTTAFVRALQAIGERGGGCLYVPPGRYLVRPLQLVSNLRLYLEAGATLVASADPGHYARRCFLLCEGLQNVTLSGPGEIVGQGTLTYPQGFRPHLIDCIGCRHIAIENIRLLDSGGWTLHLLGCEYVRVQGVTILSSFEVGNTDGIDPDSSRHVHISNCHIQAGDDCIALKTTGREGILGVTEGITVSNCTLVTKKTALKIGTETRGPIRDCSFSNIAIYGAARGIGIWMRDGSIIERLLFSNITMSLKEFPGEHMSGEPFRITCDRREPATPAGHIRNLSFNQVQVRAPYRSVIAGHPESPIERLRFRDVEVNLDGPCEKQGRADGFEISHARDAAFYNLRVFRAGCRGTTRPWLCTHDVDDVVFSPELPS